MNIKEKDWKLLRNKLPEWQERYMERLLQEYESVIHEDKPASTRFWALDKHIKEDKKNPGVLVDDVRRSTALYLIADLVQHHVITMDELHDFSDETVSFVTNFLEDA